MMFKDLEPGASFLFSWDIALGYGGPNTKIDRTHYRVAGKTKFIKPSAEVVLEKDIPHSVQVFGPKIATPESWIFSKKAPAVAYAKARKASGVKTQVTLDRHWYRRLKDYVGPEPVQNLYSDDLRR